MSTAEGRRDAVIARYSQLAQTAAAGGAPVDTPDGSEIAGCGPSAYTDTDAPVPVGVPVAHAEKPTVSSWA